MSLPDILQQIVATKKSEVAAAKIRLSEAELRGRVASGVAGPPRNFFAALTREPEGLVHIIAEVKKASPSAGVMKADFDPVAIARQYYAAGADALSVLTDEKYFGGKLEYIAAVKEAVPLPVLRKDFIIDPWQVWEARAADADSFLLIVATLSDAHLAELLGLGRELGMESLVEVHTRQELTRALAVDARIIGVNNRDLRTLEVRIETSYELIAAVPDQCIAVCESGLRSHDDLTRLRAAGFDAFLIGEHLMLQPDPAAALRVLLGC
jgi:indole-3-glycerol phosphate synthase